MATAATAVAEELRAALAEAKERNKQLDSKNMELKAKLANSSDAIALVREVGLRGRL